MPIEISVWRDDIDRDAKVLQAVLALHKRNKKSLGFLPDAAFRDRGHAGALIVAHDEDELVGYTIYDRPRSHLKLVHVCVADDHRKSGAAGLMISQMVADNPHATGFEAHCRRDYHLNGFWRSLGMSPKGERPGRGLSAEPLTVWWRPLGGPDLFGHLILETALPLAVLDTNIVIDLVASPTINRVHRESSEQLVGDWIESRIAIAISPEVNNELNDLEDATERKAQILGAQNLTRLPTNRPMDHSIEDALKDRIGATRWAKDLSLNKDVRHLADAVNSGASYFITHDDRLIAATHGWLDEEFGIRVAMPYQLLSDLAEPGSVPAYQPRHLGGSFQWREASSLPLRDLEAQFLNYPVQESATSFRRSLKNILANKERYVSHVLVRDGATLMGLVVSNIAQGVLHVPVLRVRRGIAAQTLAFQLARQLRQIAAAAGAAKVEVTDPALHPVTKAALLEDGYRQDGGPIHAVVIRGQFRLDSASDMSRLAALIGMGAGGFQAPMTPDLVAEVERRYWPLKLWDQTNCLLVPIKPEYAMNLFGYPSNLIDQRESLGLSRQHVYYRSKLNNPLKSVPARVLWYCSRDSRMGVHRVFAYSRVVGSYVLEPSTAHGRFHHMGVYKLSDVQSAAGKYSVVHVLEFEDTEVLDRPLSLKEFLSIGEHFGIGMVSPSPRAIPAPLLREVYQQANGLT